VGRIARPVAGDDRHRPEQETPAALPRVAAHSSRDTVRNRRGGLGRSQSGFANLGGRGANGGVATAVWAPPQPTLTVATDLPAQDEYEVLIHEDTESRRLVAAIEIVSPSNKDRPDNQGTFVAKCVALLQQGVAVSIVDLVTTRQFNLYADLINLLGQVDPWLIPEPAPLYAVACRWRRDESGNGERKANAWRLETWAHALEIGRPLPILPLWLATDSAVPLELEKTYEETCRILRIS
jgi:hypothetical protein